MRFHFKVLCGFGTSLGLGAGTIYLTSPSLHAQASVQDGTAYDCPYLKWDYNWDNSQKYKVSKEGKTRDGSKDCKFSRTVWLVNDVQHLRNEDDSQQKPTAVGILQGRLCAATLQRLKKAGLKWDTAYHSTMLRSAFQADVIKRALNDKDMIWKGTELLVEGMPVEVSPKAPDIPSGREYSQIYHEDHPRAEAAYRSIFYRPNQDQKKHTNDLVLSHSNLIRYFICRALQMPPEAFSRFTLNHASITKVRIDGNGYVTVEAIGDAGYLPPTLLTLGELGGAPPVMVDPTCSRMLHREGIKIDYSVTEEEFHLLLGGFKEHAEAAKMIS